MPQFATGREAKEFMVGCIVAEAQREGVPLSELERKMMYFTETAWAPPDFMEVNEAFEREYDTEEYEQKIAGLIRGFCAHVRKDDPETFSAWSEAVRVLSREDHYLLVMVGGARWESSVGWIGRGLTRISFLEILGIGLAVFFGIVLVLFICELIWA